MSSTFETLNRINVNEHTEKKNGLTYLSWAWAWAEVKKAFPDATFTVYHNAQGWIYHTDGKTAWVETGVTINGIEHIEYLPVMDFKNRSIPLDGITSVDVNKAIQRSLTKAAARHGLGLYIYAGEDLPEGEEAPKEAAKPNRAQAVKEFCAAHGITMDGFGSWRNAAVENSVIPDRRINDLTDAEFAALMRFVELNCDAGQA
jgi:hypothetical protein